MSILHDLLNLKKPVIESDQDDNDHDGGDPPKDLPELVDAYFDKFGHSLEGRSGLIRFIRLIRYMGYKDPQYYGQLDHDASIGDLIQFLEDNSGALQAMVEWIQERSNDEWRSNLSEIFEDGDDQHQPTHESVQEAATTVQKAPKKFKLIMKRDGYSGYFSGSSAPTARKPIEKVGTLEELIKYAHYTLEKGKSWEHEKGNKKINMQPKTIASLVDNLNKAENNAAKNGYSGTSYTWEPVKEEVKESADANTKYKIEWVKGYPDKGPKEVDARFFNSGNGFDDDDIEAIHELAVGETWTGGGPLDKVEVTRLTEDRLDEKVFDEDRYDWFVWHSKKPSKPFDRRGGMIQLEQGMRFGLRAATSKPGTWRMIVKQKGPSIIFSIPAGDAQELMDKSLKLR